ncbi:MAG: hypothetical protein JWN83_1510 [Chitinophagaceae bacterium]|nr:hypothetical protein [Chitinophagaceae bacterium]
MKTFFSLLILFTISFGSANAQSIKSILNSITKNSDTNSSNIADGLKEALQIGTDRSVQKLSIIDGFFANAALKILMPEEAKKAEQKLRALGFGKQVDNAILSMNRAAEDAAKSAAPIFINAIKQMTIQDAVGILRGSDFAATDYLKSKTSIALTNAFRPVIEASLEKVNATKYWNTIFTTYNKLSFNKVNPDLSAYVTDKALSGIFYQIGLEEQEIRKNPAARTTELLKKVFGSK